MWWWWEQDSDDQGVAMKPYVVTHNLFVCTYLWTHTAELWLDTIDIHWTRIAILFHWTIYEATGLVCFRTWMGASLRT